MLKWGDVETEGKANNKTTRNSIRIYAIDHQRRDPTDISRNRMHDEMNLIVGSSGPVVAATLSACRSVARTSWSTSTPSITM